MESLADITRRELSYKVMETIKQSEITMGYVVGPNGSTNPIFKGDLVSCNPCRHGKLINIRPNIKPTKKKFTWNFDTPSLYITIRDFVLDFARVFNTLCANLLSIFS